MRYFLIVLAVALGGCATLPRQAAIERIPFPEAEYAQLAGKTGTGVVTGQVFLRTRGGEVRYGAGSPVYLNPVTSYSRQWYQENYIGGRSLSAADSRAEAALIRTQADGSGDFRIENVPAGEYYLTSSVFWEAPGQYYMSKQGGIIAVLVVVQDGKETKQMLTR